MAVNDSATLFDTAEDPVEPPEDHGADTGLAAVIAWFRKKDDLEALFAQSIRQSLDEVLDGQRTGRFDVEELDKTEKSYLGTKVEIVVRAAFELPKGERMDYAIDGHDIDAKWSIRREWNIPREAMGHLCLLMSANDRKATFDVGLIRIQPELLNEGQNQDKKKTLNADGRSRIVWLFRNARLPRNLLLSLPPDVREKILASSSGQKRATELMRHVRGVLIDRNTAITVARQLDGMRRCRNTRTPLSQEGIAVLGHMADGPKIAKALQLPVPSSGTLISVRLIQVPDDTTDRPTALISGRRYAVIDSDEPTDQLPLIKNS
ncbi:NaeI family type II restriction endonuclease [Nocardia goodfellowii]|uniref:Type II restriction enzyme NaeI domain-containing protein n=1 Tax=Nocardia goodfellowii TaxID=882446 RepID=A0ABS4QPJ1_9NOCA|nr:NaeI family type II restriction endonuclease [Nocardia goodfellowii]MBP2193607.1 hypothetical protein [Nocardia goodfellowii]